MPAVERSSGAGAAGGGVKAALGGGIGSGSGGKELSTVRVGRGGGRGTCGSGKRCMPNNGALIPGGGGRA